MAELTLAAAGRVQPAGTDGINELLEVPGTAQVEAMRVTSTNATDFVYSRRFKKIKSVMVQNHGATIGTGVRDPPKIKVIQGTDVVNGKVEITHTATQEVFSLIIWGDL